MRRRFLTFWIGALLLVGPALLAQEDTEPVTYSLVVKGIV